MSAHAVPPDSVSFALLNACGETPLTTAQVVTRAGLLSGSHAATLYRLCESGLLAHGPQVPGRRRSNVTWMRTTAGDDVLRRSATRLHPLQAHILIHLSTESQRCSSVPCPADLTRARTPASWRGVRAHVLRQLAGQELIERQYGQARLTPLGFAALPDARVRLGLPETS